MKNVLTYLKKAITQDYWFISLKEDWFSLVEAVKTSQYKKLF